MYGKQVDRRVIYSADDIRTALVIAARFGFDVVTCLQIGYLLGLNLSSQGDILPGWPRGTRRPPICGWRPDRCLYDQE
jgi:hypothetical protein